MAARAYTPGLRVLRRATLEFSRQLPLAGDVRVDVGQAVAAEDVVAATLLPGAVTPLNMAGPLGVGPGDVSACLLKKLGEKVVAGEPLAESRSFFGLSRTTVSAPLTGTIESVSRITGQVILRGEPIPLEVRAYATGSVASVEPGTGAVIRARVSQLQGIFGVGGERYGRIENVCDDPARPLTPDLLRESHRGAIVVGGGRVLAAALDMARAVGVAAIVSGGIDDEDLRRLLGYDLGVAVTGSETIGFTLVITEGFGDIAMSQRAFQLLKERQGAPASVNGATQIRAGVLRPEVVIPWSNEPAEAEASARAIPEGALDVGAPVRIVRDPYFGMIGDVADLPAEPQWLESGARARVVRVRSRTGDLLTVPRANVELIEEG